MPTNMLVRTQTHNSSHSIHCVLRLLVGKTIHQVITVTHTIICVLSSCNLINLISVNYPLQAVRVHKVRPRHFGST